MTLFLSFWSITNGKKNVDDDRGDKRHDDGKNDVVLEFLGGGEGFAEGVVVDHPKCDAVKNACEDE